MNVLGIAALCFIAFVAVATGGDPTFLLSAAIGAIVVLLFRIARAAESHSKV